MCWQRVWSRDRKDAEYLIILLCWNNTLCKLLIIVLHYPQCSLFQRLQNSRVVEHRGKFSSGYFSVTAPRVNLPVLKHMVEHGTNLLFPQLWNGNKTGLSAVNEYVSAFHFGILTLRIRTTVRLKMNWTQCCGYMLSTWLGEPCRGLLRERPQYLWHAGAAVLVHQAAAPAVRALGTHWVNPRQTSGSYVTGKCELTNAVKSISEHLLGL